MEGHGSLVIGRSARGDGLFSLLRIVGPFDGALAIRRAAAYAAA